MSVFPRPLLTGFFALALLAVALGLRWPGLERQVWNLDEGSTLTMAEIVRHGGVLYRDAADNRTPLVPYLKAGVLAVAGDWNMQAVHVVLAFLIGLTAIGIWRALRAAGDEAAGAWGAIYFLLLGFVMPGAVDVMAAHTGWFLVFFSAWGMWCFVLAVQAGSAWRGLGAGVLFALATLAKQPGLLDWGACLVLCALVPVAEPRRLRQVLAVAGGLMAGWVLVIAATWLYFTANGAWGDFLRYAWDYNTKLYVPEVPLHQRLWAIRVPFIQLWASAPLALFLGAAAAVWLLTRTLPALVRRKGPLPLPEWLVLGWAASGLASTMLSGRDFGHYSIQTMPGLALGCGWITARLLRCSKDWPARRRRLILILLTIVPLSIAAVALPRAFNLEEDDPAAIRVGAAIREATRPEDRIFIWGYVPELHVFAQRLPNTRFVYAVYLTGMIPWTNLDPYKNTGYAIVPGAWDAFWSDFDRRPAEVIVDTRFVRGFSKYPLRRQERLFALVERNYAEIDAVELNALGYAVHKRTSDTFEPPDEVAPGGGVSIHVLPAAPDSSRQVAVHFPAGAHAVDLLLDGRPYRRLEQPGESARMVVFSVLSEDLTGHPHFVRSLVHSAGRTHAADAELASPDDATGQAGGLRGPPIVFPDGSQLEPVEASTIASDRIAYLESAGYWEAHAPSRLIFDRPSELMELEFSFGLAPESYERKSAQRTDGIDVLVQFEDRQGRLTQLFRRELRPITEGNDQGPQRGHVVLPLFEAGRLHLLISAGPFSNPAFDWSYWKDLRGLRSGVALRTASGWIGPLRHSTPFGLARVGDGPAEVTLAHAPTELTYPLPAEGGRLRGDYGMLESSWSGQDRSVGAIIEVRFTTPTGETRTLWERTLRPATETADRERLQLDVEVPRSDGRATLTLSTRPADPNNNAFNHTYWANLRLDPPSSP